ncbi:unnamed protein product [Prorocentrum cordatum]|uniref:Uncharacterized protein n=1 Tax=Prorocentrum cordatum TaxID=2364126 RepID=A0ABN9X122_9DINO|nr:unnamed protein product [Polarella glacialis]
MARTAAAPGLRRPAGRGRHGDGASQQVLGRCWRSAGPALLLALGALTLSGADDPQVLAEWKSACAACDPGVFLTAKFASPVAVQGVAFQDLVLERAEDGVEWSAVAAWLSPQPGQPLSLAGASWRPPASLPQVGALVDGEGNSVSAECSSTCYQSGVTPDGTFTLNFSEPVYAGDGAVELARGGGSPWRDMLVVEAADESRFQFDASQSLVHVVPQEYLGLSSNCASLSLQESVIIRMMDGAGGAVQAGILRHETAAFSISVHSCFLILGPPSSPPRPSPWLWHDAACVPFTNFSRHLEIYPGGGYFNIKLDLKPNQVCPEFYPCSFTFTPGDLSRQLFS